MLLGRYFPKLFGFTDHDVKRIFPIVQKLLVSTLKESGYMHIQATKPDTAGNWNTITVEKASVMLSDVFCSAILSQIWILILDWIIFALPFDLLCVLYFAGRGLNDSPVGLAAYILEKFSTWTDHEFTNLKDGGLQMYVVQVFGVKFTACTDASCSSL